MLALALPVIIAEIGWITMGIVDTIIVGPLGPAALGAVGTGSTLFFTVMVFGMGTLFALDAFVAQSSARAGSTSVITGCSPACNLRR